MSHGFKFPLPEHVAKLIDKADRLKAGIVTAEERAAQAEIKSERDLHKAIASLLRLRGIEFFESRMDRRTTRPKGEPDFIFSVIFEGFDKRALRIQSLAVPVAWECKIAGRPLSEDQQAMFRRMTRKPNGWHCACIRSVDDALNELRRLGL